MPANTDPAALEKLLEELQATGRIYREKIEALAAFARAILAARPPAK
jgi:hypothetical protein